LPERPAVERHHGAKVSMKNYVLIGGALSLFLSNAAMAQHGGTEQEQRACSGNVER
jgi:hypothetical protein